MKKPFPAFQPRRWREVIFLPVMLLLAAPAGAEKNMELETTRIKVNEELPQILYIVPWKDFEPGSSKRFKLQLHDFFGDLYEPQLPSSAPGVKPQEEKATD